MRVDTPCTSKLRSQRALLLGAVLLCTWLVPMQAGAADGIIEINQVAVMAGNITTGDGLGFPATLSQPGSYMLTGNLTLPSENDNGIEITAEGVTLDLNGFSIIGPTSCTLGRDCSPLGSGIGIIATTSLVTIRNGRVSGAGNIGVLVSTGSGARASFVEQIATTNNGSHGLATAAYGTVRDCVAHSNGGTGIVASAGSTLLYNTVSFNGLDGLAMGSAANDGNGVVRGNTSYANVRYGFLVGSGSSVVGNAANHNGSYGFRLGSLAGYGNNVLDDNNSSGTQRLGGRSMGNNVCAGVAEDDC